MRRKLTGKKFADVLNQVPADYYDQGIKKNLLQKYWHNRKWKTLDKFLSGCQRDKLLDLGCADGTTTNHIYQSFPQLKITGIDYYKKAIDFARKTKPQIKFVVGDIHKLPFADGYFDYVTAIEVLEHLHNPKKALGEVNRVLKPDGYLIVGQDTNSLLFRLIWWFWRKWVGSVWNHSHISCVSSRKLVTLVEKSKFQIRQSELINLKMEIFIKAQKMKQ